MRITGHIAAILTYLNNKRSVRHEHTTRRMDTVL